MKKFEIGKEYFTRSICDSECIFSIKITGRTAKTVSYEYMGESRRSKIRFDDSGEYIQPDRYSTVFCLWLPSRVGLSSFPPARGYIAGPARKGGRRTFH